MGTELIVGVVSVIGTVFAIVVSILWICKSFSNPLFKSIENLNNKVDKKFDGISKEIGKMQKTLAKIQTSLTCTGKRVTNLEKRKA